MIGYDVDNLQLACRQVTEDPLWAPRRLAGATDCNVARGAKGNKEQHVDV